MRINFSISSNQISIFLWVGKSYFQPNVVEIIPNHVLYQPVPHFWNLWKPHTCYQEICGRAMIKAAEFKFQKSFLSCYSLWRGTYFHTMDKNLRQWECGSFKWKRKEGGEEMGVVWKPQNGKVLWCMKNSNYVFLLFILPVQRDQPRSVLHTEIHKSSLLKITSKSDAYVDYTNYALSLPGKRATTI